MSFCFGLMFHQISHEEPMAKKKRLTRDDFLKQLEKFLFDGYALPLKIGELYERVQDDHDGTFEGQLRLQLSPDNDVWITTDLHHGPPMRFRMPMFGGGSSPHTVTALKLLAYAIELDNKKHPQRRPPPFDQH